MLQRGEDPGNTTVHCCNSAYFPAARLVFTLNHKLCNSIQCTWLQSPALAEPCPQTLPRGHFSAEELVLSRTFQQGMRSVLTEGKNNLQMGEK